MNTFRNSQGKGKPDYLVRFFVTEFIICAFLFAVCFALFKLAPDTFIHIKNSFSAFTKDGFTIPEIGSFLSHAAQDVMEYLGVAQPGNA